jgi:hypothetical protein
MLFLLYFASISGSQRYNLSRRLWSQQHAKSYYTIYTMYYVFGDNDDVHRVKSLMFKTKIEIYCEHLKLNSLVHLLIKRIMYLKRINTLRILNITLSSAPCHVGPCKFCKCHICPTKHYIQPMNRNRVTLE